MAGHKIIKTSDPLETESTDQVTILTLDEDDLGAGTSDDYAVGLHITLVSRSENDAYQGMAFAVAYFARDSGAIESLGISTTDGEGAAATLAVSDEAPDIAIQITPPYTSKTIHRVWVEIFAVDDAYSA